jgi:hypothetical protein
MTILIEMFCIKTSTFYRKKIFIEKLFLSKLPSIYCNAVVIQVTV